MTVPLTASLRADLNNFIDWLRGCGMAATTVDKRSLIVAGRLAEWGTWDVMPAVITAWLGKYDGWTKHTYYLHLKSAFRFAVEWGLLAASPMTNIKRPPRPEPKPRPLSSDELTLVLGTATPQLRRFLLLAYLAGLRAHEIAKVRGEDVTRDTIRVLGKGGDLTLLPTHPLLWELAQQMPATGWWFPSPTSDSHITPGWVTKAIGRHLRKQGIKSGSIHRVRASCLTDLLRKGAHIRIVQTVARHRSLETTERYLAVADDEVALALTRLVA